MLKNVCGDGGNLGMVSYIYIGGAHIFTFIQLPTKHQILHVVIEMSICHMPQIELLYRKKTFLQFAIMDLKHYYRGDI